MLGNVDVNKLRIGTSAASSTSPGCSTRTSSIKEGGKASHHKSANCSPSSSSPWEAGA